MLQQLQGYRTVIGFSIALACALWQTFVGPLPVLDPSQFATIVTIFGLVMRFATKTPVGQKS